MKYYQNIVVYLVIPLALLSIPSLLENVQAQTNSTNQTQAQMNEYLYLERLDFYQPNSTNQISQQKNQNMNLIAQALMKVNIFEIKDTLMKAKLAILDGHSLEALTGVRDVETELLLIEPSPTKFLNDIHKAIYAIARSDIDKSLDILTKIQFDILKAENEIFKAAVANPQMMQQVKAAVANPQMMQKFNTIEPNNNVEKDSKDVEKDSKDVEKDSKDARQQFNTMETETIIDEEEYYTDKEDT